MNHYRESKFGRYMMIGGLLGATASLFHRGTRASLKESWEDVVDNTKSFYYTVRTNPQAVQDYLSQTTNNIKMTAQDVSNDMSEMAISLGGARQSTTEAYQYAMEAGDEVGQIATKIQTARQGLTSLPPATAPTNTVSHTMPANDPNVTVNQTMPNYSQNNLTTPDSLPVDNSTGNTTQPTDATVNNTATTTNMNCPTSTAENTLPVVTSQSKQQ